MHLLALCLLTLVNVLSPGKGWYAPAQPLNVTAHADTTLVLTDFAGKAVGSAGSARVASEQSVDIRAIFPVLGQQGTYVLFATPAGDPNQFVGTPVVIEVRPDARRGAPEGPMVLRTLPLRYAILHTEQGDMTAAFYYDSAPNTIENFLRLASEGFYDGLPFHRVVPDFVAQTGDPRGDGTGTPGYTIDAEFNDRQHQPGVLSMARSSDPNEAAGGIPRPEFANSAGSQFFICLNYEHTRFLDRKYTAFGQIIQGMETVRKIGATPIADGKTGRPVTPPVVTRIEILDVTPDHNPYADIVRTSSNETFLGGPRSGAVPPSTTLPSTFPTTRSTTEPTNMPTPVPPEAVTAPGAPATVPAPR